MRNVLFILLAGAGMFFSAHAEEQEYCPMLNENFTWSYCDIMERTVDGASVYDITYSQNRIQGDTTINGVTYKKMYGAQCSEWSYLAAMREEGKKVYTVSDQLPDGKEYLLYDFDLEEGDVVPAPYKEPEIVVVTEVDTVETAFGPRKRIIMPGDTWIEGIGSIERYVECPLSPVPLYDLGIRFNYQKQGAEIVYKTDGFWFKENECETSLFPILPAAQDIRISQPAQGVLCITTDAEEAFDVDIYDLSGQQLLSLQGTSGQHLDVSALPDGMYIAVLHFADGTRHSEKVVKQL